MLILTVIRGPDQGRRFELPDDEPQCIGRSAESLPLTDLSISRRHAELTPDDGRWYIRDLESANGTFVNGKRVSGSAMLQPGEPVLQQEPGQRADHVRPRPATQAPPRRQDRGPR